MDEIMKIYLLHQDFDRYEILTYSNLEDSKRIQDWFCGEPIGNRWTPLKVEVLRDKDHKDRPSSDFPGFGAGKSVFSHRALESLRDMLDGNGEILPLDCKDGNYWVFNVTRMVDALNVEGAKVKRFSDGGIMRVEQYSFRPEKIHGLTIFKIPQFPFSDVYVTDAFVERVKGTGLTGFAFDLLWDSENFERP
jgi:hypothetical protein